MFEFLKCVYITLTKKVLKNYVYIYDRSQQYWVQCCIYTSWLVFPHSVQQQTHTHIIIMTISTVILATNTQIVCGRECPS